MKTRFWQVFAHGRLRLQQAIQEQDHETWNEIVDELSVAIREVDQRLGISVQGPEPYRLWIRALPGAESVAERVAERVARTHQAPSEWQVIADASYESDPLQSVQLRDEDGRLLTLPYGKLGVRVLAPRDGLITIVMSCDAAFDPTGENAYMYQAAAEHVAVSILGMWPPQLARVVMVPVSESGMLAPLTTLRQQWLTVSNDVVSDGET